jgi:hypothetical protein
MHFVITLLRRMKLSYLHCNAYQYTALINGPLAIYGLYAFPLILLSTFPSQFPSFLCTLRPRTMIYLYFT